MFTYQYHSPSILSSTHSPIHRYTPPVTYTFMHPSTNPDTHPSIHTLSIYQSIHPLTPHSPIDSFIHLSIHTSILLSIHTPTLYTISIYQSIHTSILLSIHTPTLAHYPSINPFTHSSIHLSIHPPFSSPLLAPPRQNQPSIHQIPTIFWGTMGGIGIRGSVPWRDDHRTFGDLTQAFS